MEDNIAKGKSRQIWGWIFYVSGALFSIAGTLLMVLWIYKAIFDEQLYSSTIDTMISSLSLMLLLVGIPLLWHGTNLLLSARRDSENRRMNEKIIQLSGWIIGMVGVLFTLVGIFISTILMMNHSEARLYDTFVAVFVVATFVAVGILLLVRSLKWIIFKGT
jgi:hypothetical protein